MRIFLLHEKIKISIGISEIVREEEKRDFGKRREKKKPFVIGGRKLSVNGREEIEGTFKGLEA